MTTPRKRTPANTIIETDDDVLRGVRALSRKCPVMKRLYKANGTPPLRRRQPGFAGLVRIVVGQQVSVASANAIWERCVNGIAPLSAQRVAELTEDDFKACGLSRPKIRTLRAISDAVLGGELDLDGAARLPDEEFREDLLRVSGIGPWTADVFQMFCLGKRDVFAAGDLALQVAAQDAFGLDSRPTAEELQELAEQWRPWRAVSARLLWAHYAALKQGRSGIGV